jgi:SAM-dependent methyltransferase
VNKRYDREYFETWYRAADTRIESADSLARRVRLAVSLAEYLLGRRLRTVLDVGCGEGRWYPVLRRLRPGVRYRGVDPSDYVLRRYGRARHIQRGTVGGLHQLRLPRGFDLIVCADVTQYVPTADLARGLAEIRRLLGGVAYIETYASEDDMEGDDVGWHRRRASTYRQLFRRAGFLHCGPYCWIDARHYDKLNAFERMRP